MVSATAAAAAAAPAPQDRAAPGAPAQLSRAVPVQRAMLDPVANLSALFDDKADGTNDMDIDGDLDADSKKGTLSQGGLCLLFAFCMLPVFFNTTHFEIVVEIKI